MSRPTPPADTAWARFETARGLSAGAHARTLRRLELHAPRLNLDAATVGLAGEIASLAPEVDPTALTLLVLISLADTTRGSTRTPLRRGHIERHLMALLGPVDPTRSEPRTAEVLAVAQDPAAAAVIGTRPTDYTPLIRQDGHLYQQRLLVAEAHLAELLGERLMQPRPPLSADALADVWARPTLRNGTPIELSDEQKRAVSTSACGALTLISGGPGTGKTSIVVALLRGLVRGGVDPRSVALAAPTGKAAWRMGQSVRQGLAGIADPGEPDLALLKHLEAPQTLHRLLGYSPRREAFTHHRHNPLAATLVIIDETTMVDAHLMERLVGALQPKARLILLGDSDQLPSVAAGAVFREVLRIREAPTVQLTKSFRMRADDPAGSAVLTVAGHINDGNPAIFGPNAAIARPSLDDLSGSGVEAVDLPPQRRSTFFDRWYTQRVRGDERIRQHRADTYRLDDTGQVHGAGLAALFAYLETSRLLCLTRSFEMGAERTNARLHGHAARAANQPSEIPLLVGEPVMMRHNDYDRRLFNGDQGLVLWVEDATRRRPMAVFPGETEGTWRGFALDALAGRLDLAYALTVHKAQGSEYDAIAVLLPDADLPLLTRELLYTAVTRARRSVWLVGDRDLMAKGIRRRIQRFGGLADRLNAHVSSVMDGSMIL
jgi:exodeoxyribonuclease V alpha subunit